MNPFRFYAKLVFLALILAAFGWSVFLRPEKAVARVPETRPLSTIDDQIRSVLPLAPGVSFAELRGLIAHESSFRSDAQRFEPHLFARYRKKGLPEARARALATSWGLTQVLGATAERWGVSVAELRKDPELQIHLGAHVYGGCKRFENGSRFYAFACYNAGPRKNRRYPAQAIRYAERATGKISGKVASHLKKKRVGR